MQATGSYHDDSVQRGPYFMRNKAHKPAFCLQKMLVMEKFFLHEEIVQEEEHRCEDNDENSPKRGNTRVRS